MAEYAPYKPLTKKQEWLKAGLENFNKFSVKQAEAAIRKYAKTANQRLRRIEHAGLTNASSAYRYIEAKAFDSSRWLDLTKAGEIKFKATTKGRSLQEMKEELSQLYTFLYESKTSTVGGTKTRYEKQFETFREHWKSETGNYPDISFDDFGYMWQLTGVQRVIEIYGSKEVIRLVQKAKADGLSWQEIDQVFEDAYKGGFSVRWTRRSIEDINKQHLESITDQKGIEDALNDYI